MSLWEWIADDCGWCHYDYSVLGEGIRGQPLFMSASRVGTTELDDSDTIGNCPDCRSQREGRARKMRMAERMTHDGLLHCVFHGDTMERKMAAYWLREATQ